MKMFSLACKDAGLPTCNYVAMGETKDEVLKMAKDHMVKDHPDKLKEMQEKMSSEEMDMEMINLMQEKDDAE
ncbi:MAG: DUF1059 domain-containing protein [Candidatus Staskawiczbacteria bacterium]|nr:DUF1059 domain-containing protein [Candidatus Staskawiczbacteria bacterium]